MVFQNVVHNIIRPLRYVNTCQLLNLNTRQYARWTYRKPVAVVNEEELFDPIDTTEETPTRSRTFKRKPRQRKSVKQATETKTTETKRLFTNFKENDKVITTLLTKLRTRKQRDKCKEIILEGHRLIKDALGAGLVPNAILFNDFHDIKQLDLPKDVILYKVPYQTLNLWSSLTTSPGLLGIFNTPDVQNNEPVDNALPLTIICDNVREPGNLGSIMRAAAAVGCEKLILMKGCVDLWDPKVIRSAAGSHFHVPIHMYPVWDEVPSLISDDCNVFIADSNFGDEYIKKYSYNTLEPSLNVFDVDPDIFKNKSATEEETNKAPGLIIPKNKEKMNKFMLKLPILPYYSVDYTKKEIVIILTGETEGLSPESYKFLGERNGIRVNIPLVNGVDSLNTGVALGIITFEIKRQFLKKQSEL